MEFHENLQELRKQKGITQEELAGALFVSRTAVSKWESGRGYPNIDSLKALAAFYGVTVDALLSGEELLCLADQDQKEKARRFATLLFGILDLCAAALLLLPFFGQPDGDQVLAVPLLALTGVSPWLTAGFYVAVGALSLLGILTLTLQNHAPWVRLQRPLSLILQVGAVLLFILARQVYACAYLFLFFVLKLLLTRNVSPK